MIVKTNLLSFKTGNMAGFISDFYRQRWSGRLAQSIKCIIYEHFVRVDQDKGLRVLGSNIFEIWVQIDIMTTADVLHPECDAAR